MLGCNDAFWRIRVTLGRARRQDVHKKNSRKEAGPERTRAGKAGWRFQPHCRITRPSSCSESIKQPPTAAGRRQIYDALICRNGKAHGRPYLTLLAKLYRLILSKLHAMIANHKGRIYKNDTNLLYLYAWILLSQSLNILNSTCVWLLNWIHRLIKSIFHKTISIYF